MPRWTGDDVRIIVDGLAVVTGGLILRALAMLAVETYIKPALIWLGIRAYQNADQLSGDRLPDFFPKKDNGQDSIH